MSARSFKRSHAKRNARERRRLANAKRRALVAGATIGATAVLAANAEAATYQVNSTADTGTGVCGTTCTLRDAITTANNNGVAGTPDTITFASSVTGKIDLTQGQISITDPGGLSIEGPGASTLYVSGVQQAGDGIFAITSGASAPVSISGLKLTQGSFDGNGGAIHDLGTPLTLTDDTITDNSVLSGEEGGAIYADSDLTISGSTITGNTSLNGDAGAIWAFKRAPSPGKYNLTISDSTISGNIAERAGAIESNSFVSISDSQIDSNQATDGIGGGLYLQEGSLSLTDSTVSQNTSTSSGGGIFEGSKYGVTIDNSTISGNSAADGGGIEFHGEVPPGSGPQNPILVESSTISGNDAAKGAGIELDGTPGNTPVTIKASTISGNQGGADSVGGGLLITGELYNPFDLVDSTISGNGATDGAGVSLSYSGSTTKLLGTGGSISFDNSTIDANTAGASGHGGGIYLANYNSGTDASGTAAINSTIVANNTANGLPNDLFQGDTTSGGVNDTFSLIENPGNAQMLSSQALITGIDPQLNPLANNGGPTETMLPKNTSPVIDQGKAQSGLTTDQRGDPRTVDNGKPRPPGGDGTDIGAVELAKIPPPPPPSPPTKPGSISATVGPASGITDTSATLNGSINTSGQAVTWHFQYGTSTAYGKVTTTESISAGHGQVPVSFKVSGLKAGTRYHYRVVAVSASGQSVTSSDATFKTPAPTIKVKPGAVRAAHAVRFFGSAGACTRGSQVTLTSSVFSSAHKFRGHNAIHAKVGAGNKYSVVTRIPAGRAPGRYAITARCDGATFGVTASLRVLPPPPVIRFTG